jgi:hypothetical protein
LSSQVEGTWEADVIAWASNESFLATEDGWLIGNKSASPHALGVDDFIAFDDQGQLDAVRSDVTPFENDRYYLSIFGARDTRSVDMTLRGTMTFTPTLSLQLYSQLFLARGRYNELQLLKDRDTLIPFDSFPKRNEFAFSTLTSNMVLRWEYRPGSTVFLVWTHGRRADDVLNPLAPQNRSPYERRISGQIGDTFDIIPTNVFLVKVSYTFL